MTITRSLWITSICTIGLLLAIAIVAQYSPPPNVGFKDAAAILSIITASAVGIERVIETFWTIIGLMKSSWWPLNQISTQIDTMVADLDQHLEPFYKDAESKLQELEKLGGQAQSRAAAARKTLTDTKARIAELKSLASDNQTIGLIVSTANDGINYLQASLGAFGTTASIAQQALDSISNFVTTLKDNPGRKLISIYLGAIIGLIVAWAAGLDLFKAVLQDGVSTTTGSLGSANTAFFPHIGVALTGVVMGLGSNPTHEVIRVLQEIKKKRRTENEEDRLDRVTR